MPNWCSNRLVVNKVSNVTNKFLEFIKSDYTDFDYNNVIPYPQEFKAMDEKVDLLRKSGVKWSDLPKDGYNSGGYEWCINNWGTKCNNTPDGVNIVERSDEIEITFESPWGPPELVVAELSNIFPNLIFRLEFEEPGMNFSGYLTFKDGEVIDDFDGEFGDYKLSDDEYYDYFLNNEYDD